MPIRRAQTASGAYPELFQNEIREARRRNAAIRRQAVNLPRPQGAHQAVLDAGEKESGCTVHLVTAEVDGGAVVVQRTVPVNPEDTPESLKAKVQAQEGPALVRRMY